MPDTLTAWQKSSFSNSAGGDCLEIRADAPHVLVRDSKYLRDPANSPAAQPIICVAESLWPGFLDRVRSDVAISRPGLPDITHCGTGTNLTCEGIVLSFTPAEWNAFTAGVQAGEFDLSHQRATLGADSGATRAGSRVSAPGRVP